MGSGGGWVAVMAAVVLGAGAAALGQVTRVATFENYVEGDSFKPSFTDPLSGVTFRDSTAYGQGFVVDYGIALFGGSKYLTAGSYTPGDGWALGYDFGFTADLPTAAKSVGFDVTYSPGTVSSPAGMTLTGYNAAGAVVALTTVSGYVASPFRLEVASSTYDIVRVTVAVPDIATGYDNVSYMVLPEPTGVGIVVGAGVLLRRRRGTRPARGAAKRRGCLGSGG